MSGAAAALAGLWAAAGLPPGVPAGIALPGEGPVLPSSFAVATAAQASLAAAAGAAAMLAAWRRPAEPGPRVSVDRHAAALECTGAFTLDGRAPDLWDPLSGLYRCGEALGAPGWVRVHANFAHHRDAALALLGLPPGADTPKTAVAGALRHWRAEAFESAAAEAGAVATALRTEVEWQAHAQAAAVRAEPLVAIERIGEAAPLRWPGLPPAGRPLAGLRVLDLTRILAGPVAARLLALYGADVLMVNGPHLPNIAAIADLSRGKRSALLDLRADAGRESLRRLVRDAHVFLQGYRPGALAARGFDPAALATLRPGIVCVSLAAWGFSGPWAGHRGFDSLVQTSSGFNVDEAAARGSEQPAALPVQILDYAAGHLLAFGTQAALWRQAHDGGSWHVKVSLAGVGHWLRSLGREPGGLAVAAPDPASCWVPEPSGFGALCTLPHAARFDGEAWAPQRQAMPPGSDPPAWP